MLVSRHDELIEFARASATTASRDYAPPGLNFRMNEFTAALGIVGASGSTRSSRGRTRVARTQLDPCTRTASSSPRG